ncbi:hypothetical protein HK104_009176 [Borealophlyctis nickersoniae]|nr:hypothetical protein HK104_009176 [Borealophlyctis nickersoniae]
MTYILEELKEGKKLYIFTPYKSGKRGVDHITQKITTYFGWEENKQVLSYFADKEEEKKKLCDVEELWAKDEVRCVVTNGTISVGVNFDLKDVFDRVYAHYSNLISVRDFLQSLYRVRHPIKPEMYLVRTRTCVYGEPKDPSKNLDCDIYRQMRKNIRTEFIANLNYGNWETFNMMCSIANITIRPLELNTAIVTNETYLEHLKSKIDLVFAWHRIADIQTFEEFEKKLFKSYSNTATLDDRLEVEKFIFRRKFPADAFEDDMEEVWKKKKGFVDKVFTLLEQPDHVINLLLRENGLDIEKHDIEDLPRNMVTNIPLDTFRDRLEFTQAVKNYKSGLVAQVLNAFFEMKVYGIEKVKKRKRGDEDEDGEEELVSKRQSKGSRKDRKQEYIYTCTETYSNLMLICQQYCKDEVAEQNQVYKVIDGGQEEEDLEEITEVEDEEEMCESVCGEEEDVDLELGEMDLIQICNGWTR